MKKQKKIQRVLMMAGGTGGHVFPGIVIADYFRHQQVDVQWLGTRQGLEAYVVPQAGFPLHFIEVNGLRGSGFKKWAYAPFKLTRALWQAKRIIHALKPDIVLGLGGFVSGPGGVASWLLRRSLIIHEQNAIPGLTNKILANFAHEILTGFPHVFKHRANVHVVGNPVRAEIEQLPAPIKRLKTTKPFRLLVLGGSLGAQVINQWMPQVMEKLSAEERPILLHQTGEKHFAQTLQAYRDCGLDLSTQEDIENHDTGIKVLPFINDMKAAYAFADMVLCRAGALTIAELCAVGVGSILIPFPYAVDDHQSVNAKFMVDNGASLCMQQAELTVDKLVSKIKYFISSPEKRIEMAQSAYRLRQEQVAEKIYNLISKLS